MHISLRDELKARRESHTPAAQISKAQAVAEHLFHWPALKATSHIASYLSHKGEVSTQRLNSLLWQQGKTVYVPLLNKDGQPLLHFQSIHHETPLLKNRFGISEPHSDKALQRLAEDMDIILLPLLGFDHKGNRLGMGGGFYDRTLAFILPRRSQPAPYLLGVAYDNQQIPSLESRPWDVPLDGVLTESGLISFKR